MTKISHGALCSCHSKCYIGKSEFCLDNKDANARETVGCKFNEMLDRYPGKVRELKQYLNSFSSDFKKEIKESLMRCADFE